MIKETDGDCFETMRCLNQNLTFEATKKEFELLNFFLKNRNRVLSREYIQESLWKDEYPKQSRIVDVHTHNLRTKLKNNCANATIGSRRGIGYILEKKK